jgi:hypothetical protein
LTSTLDLPVVIQAYFLGRTLGEDRLLLDGAVSELERAAEVVKIGSPGALQEVAVTLTSCGTSTR